MNERKIGFNFIDLLIILLIALAAALVLWVIIPKLTKSQEDSNKKQTILYTVEILNVDTETANEIKDEIDKMENAVVLDGIDQNTELGHIDSVEVPKYEKIVFDYEDGFEKKAEVSGKSILRVTIKAEATETKSSFTVGNKAIRVGEQYSLILPNFYGYGYCVSLYIDGKKPGQDAAPDKETNELEANPGTILFGSSVLPAIRAGG